MFSYEKAYNKYFRRIFEIYCVINYVVMVVYEVYFRIICFASGKMAITMWTVVVINLLSGVTMWPLPSTSNLPLSMYGKIICNNIGYSSLSV